ncbi:hypothetical protein ACFL59_06105 [Planctomycetota bacterium]
MTGNLPIRLLLVLAAAALLCAACDRGAPRPTTQPDTSDPALSAAEKAPTALGHSATATPSAQQPAQVVFIDRERCCDCTRKQIDATWQALQAVLGKRPDLPVTRYHLDTQKAEVEMYQLLRPMQFVPAVYVLDRDGDLLDLLQGELTEQALGKALGVASE